MLASSTHDTKRSEDVRARLDVLSEMPQQWSAHVFRVRRMNQPKLRSISDGRAVPDLNESYLLYQTLVGVWPWKIADSEQREDLIRRLQAYMSKALHEAKVNLSWINQNPEYVQAMQDFIAEILTAKRRENPFVSQMEDFMPPVAFFGAMNSLTQTVLKLTSPGSPDIYQGADLWDFSLVDPDNRRPVDYDTRQELMKQLCSAESGDLNVLCEDLLRNYHDGRIKLWTIMRTSRFRRANPDLFRHSTYAPLQVTAKQEHVCAFMRSVLDSHQAGCSTMISIVPRLSYTLMRGKMQTPLGEAWEQTELVLPESSPEWFENLYTGERLKRSETGTLLCREIFARFPVAVLVGI